MGKSRSRDNGRKANVKKTIDEYLIEEKQSGKTKGNFLPISTAVPTIPAALCGIVPAT